MVEDERLAEIERLRNRLAELEAEVDRIGRRKERAWPPRTYYTTYHVLAGMVLGLIGAASSLLFNVVGALMFGKHPLELIRVYLTFPLGERALSLENSFTLAAGCCLYLGTGMIGGIPFHLILSRYFSRSSFGVRFLVASVLAIGVWLINFYGVLYWLQPALIGGRWIVERIPVLVAVLTHLVFGWTLLLVDQWGRYIPPAEYAEEGGR
ncbi:MAG: hypothetical protein D6788_06005 [Planctomycetota bacterium]|nr:MAG: hypothetical protein D6788_06005 [Planctomycetota bacterium]